MKEWIWTTIIYSPHRKKYTSQAPKNYTKVLFRSLVFASALKHSRSWKVISTIPHIIIPGSINLWYQLSAWLKSRWKFDFIRQMTQSRRCKRKSIKQQQRRINNPKCKISATIFIDHKHVIKKLRNLYSKNWLNIRDVMLSFSVTERNKYLH